MDWKHFVLKKDLARRWLSLTCASVHVALAGLFLMQRVESEADGSHNTKTKRAVRYRHRRRRASVTGRVRRVHTMLRIESLDENGTASKMTARDCSPSSTHIAFEPPELLSDPPAAASRSLLLPVVSGGTWLLFANPIDRTSWLALQWLVTCAGSDTEAKVNAVP